MPDTPIHPDTHPREFVAHPFERGTAFVRAAEDRIASEGFTLSIYFRRAGVTRFAMRNSPFARRLLAYLRAEGNAHTIGASQMEADQAL